MGKKKEKSKLNQTFLFHFYILLPFCFLPAESFCKIYMCLFQFSSQLLISLLPEPIPLSLYIFFVFVFLKQPILPFSSFFLIFLFLYSFSLSFFSCSAHLSFTALNVFLPVFCSPFFCSSHYPLLHFPLLSSS